MTGPRNDRKAKKVLLLGFGTFALVAVSYGCALQVAENHREIGQAFSGNDVDP